MRSKRRRPFTEEEDKALKAGYEKHGTVWATIVKDPVFQGQNRRSTDLRDRFRNAYPDLYQAAGYKPRNKKKTKEHLITTSATTDDQLPGELTGRTGPVRGTRRRRAQTCQGILLRGGTKSVPQSTAPSEDEESSQEDTDADLSSHLKTQEFTKTPALVDQPSMMNGVKNIHLLSPGMPVEASFSSIVDDQAEIDMRLVATEPLSSDPLAEYPPPTSALDSQSQIPHDDNFPAHIHHSTWSSSVSHNAANDGGGGGSNPPGSSTTANNSSHPPIHAQISTPQQQYGSRGLKVGQSAWGPQEWLSPNPRLDSSFNSPINSTTDTNGNAAVTININASPGTGTPSSYFSPPSPFNLTSLHTSQSLSPSTTAAAIQTSNNVAAQNVANDSAAAASTNLSSLTGLTTLNLPMNNYISHQHHHVIERYDLWPPALALTSSLSAVNNSSAWSSVLSGSGGPFSGPGSLSTFSSSFGGDFESEVSFDTQSQTFSDDREHQDVFGGDETYNLGYTTANATGNGGVLPVARAITHHSDYAGDLIFGARGYGIGGGFGWFGSAYGHSSNGIGGNAININNSQSAVADGTVTGLGLVGITKGDKEMGEGVKDSGDGVVSGDGRGNINPMQLHASSSGVDNSQERDMDEEMSDVMDTTNQSTTCSSINVDAESGLASAKTPSPEKQQQRQNVRGGPNSTEVSPVQVRMGHMSPPLHMHSHHHHQQQHLHPLHQDGFPTHHGHHNTHTLTHNGHSLSLSLGPSTIFSPSPASLSTPGINTYGRFSFDDLDLVDLTQQNTLADMNNLTPPATPMIQHATHLRGGKKYGTSNLGLSGSGRLGVGGGSPFMHGLGQEQTDQQEQGHGVRSISVPPSEARNPIGSPAASFASTSGAVERGRPKIVDTMGAGKRSLSSTVPNFPGPNISHGHSSSLSTLPPFPSHSDIWRSTTPTARASTVNNAPVTQSQGLSSTHSTGGADTIPDATNSLFSHLFSSPPTPFGSSTSSGVAPSGIGIGVNSDVNTNADLPFLDLHYNFGQHPNNQQFQQNFGATAMLVDTPAPTPGIPRSSSTNGCGMTQAEVEARQALDLAQPFGAHINESAAHAQALQYLGLHSLVPNHTQQSDFGYPSTSASDAAGLKALSHAFSIPPNLSRQVFTPTLVRSQQQQQLGHQGMQSQQVVNPKDLVLNANGAGAVGLSGGGGEGGISGLESRRKRASWDGSIL